ncbi:MAG: hypothetical protein V4463_07960 [Pseudomonadota bacterium]
MNPLFRRQSGIALLESLLAVLVLAIGLIGTLGLQARAAAALSDASMRAEATMATDKLLGLMSNDYGNLAQYALAAGATPSASLAGWYADTRGAIPDATIVVTVTPAANMTTVTTSISWTRKAGEVANSHQVTSYLAP